MSVSIGKIVGIEGVFHVKGVDGSVRKILDGDTIYEGEIVIGNQGNNPSDNIVVSMKDGSDIIVLGHEKQLFDASLSAQEFAKEETVTQKDSIQAILEANGDIENIGDLETAAGEGITIQSTEGGEANFASANNASTDINAELRQRAFEDERFESSEDVRLGETLEVDPADTTAINDPLILTVVVNDIATTNEDSAVIIDVLANDTDIDADGVKSPVASVTDGAHGTVLINANGTLTYTPTANYNGVDSFTYTNAEGATATVNVTINPANDNPVAVNDTISILEDMNNTQNVYTLATSDFGTYSDIDGDALSAVKIDTLPANGVLYLNGTAISSGAEILATDIDAGRLTFNPIDHSDVDGNFTFSVSDGTNWSSSSYTTTINITAVADAPTLSVIGSTTLTQEINIGNVTSTSNGFTISAYKADGTASTISVNGSPSGFGVAGAASGADSELGYLSGVGSEKIVVGFNQDIASVDVSFAWKNPTENATYTFYKDGVVVGTGTSVGGSDGVDSAVTLQPDSGALFDTIIFSAPRLGDDYLINSITYDKVESTSGAIVVNELDSVGLNISSSLVDTDGSESLTVVLKDIPVGFVLSDGTNTFTADVSTTSVNITGWNIGALTLTTPNISTTTTYTLNVVATATEFSNGDIASTTLPIEVTVNNNPNLMILNDNIAQVNEAALSIGTSSASTAEIAAGNILSDDTLPSGAILSNISIVGGSTDSSVAGIITVTTAEGNKLVVNTATGDYTYTLINAVNHSIAGEEIDTFAYTVTDSSGLSSTANLSVRILDDAPVVNNATSVSISLPEPADTNIIFTLDVSGSMDTIVSGTTTRFDIAKQALIDTINVYSQQGDVNVNLTLFNGGAVSLGWKNETEILDYLSKLTMNHSTDTILYNGATIVGLTNVYTNYEAALSETPTTYSTNLPTADKTVAYFISDGAPTVENNEGNDKKNNVGTDSESGWLDASYVTNWTNFIAANSIDLMVIGIGTNLSTYYLDLVQVQVGEAAIVVSDATQLSDVITSTIALIEGSLYSLDGSAGINFGADGGHISELIYGTTTYTYDVANPTQTIALSEGSMELNFETGDYVYTPTINSGNDLVEEFNLTVVDNDGDIYTSSLTLSIGVGETFAFNETTDIDGGAGYDTFLVIGDDNIDFSGLSNNISNIEAINLGSGAQTITLGLNDVLDMTDENNVLRIDGDSSDHLSLDTITSSNPAGEWTLGESIVIDNQEYSRYVGEVGGSEVTLEVSTNIQVDES